MPKSRRKRKRPSKSRSFSHQRKTSKKKLSFRERSLLKKYKRTYRATSASPLNLELKTESQVWSVKVDDREFFLAVGKQQGTKNFLIVIFHKKPEELSNKISNSFRSTACAELRIYDEHIELDRIMGKEICTDLKIDSYFAKKLGGIFTSIAIDCATSLNLNLKLFDDAGLKNHEDFKLTRWRLIRGMVPFYESFGFRYVDDVDLKKIEPDPIIEKQIQQLLQSNEFTKATQVLNDWWGKNGRDVDELLECVFDETKEKTFTDIKYEDITDSFRTS